MLTLQNRSLNSPYGILINEDEYSYWVLGVLVDASTSAKILFGGILASKGIYTQSKNEIRNYQSEGVRPPLYKTLSARNAEINSLSADDVHTYWRKNVAFIEIQKSLSMVMDFDHWQAYTRAVTRASPYGKPLSQWEER